MNKFIIIPVAIVIVLTVGSAFFWFLSKDGSNSQNVNNVNCDELGGGARNSCFLDLALRKDNPDFCNKAGNLKSKCLKSFEQDQSLKEEHEQTGEEVTQSSPPVIVNSPIPSVTQQPPAVSPSSPPASVPPSPAAVSLNWVTGDTHVHSTGCQGKWQTPQATLGQLQAGSVQIGSILAWGASASCPTGSPYCNDQCGSKSTQSFPAEGCMIGKDHAVSTAANIMHYDVEISGGQTTFPAANLGHINLLGLSSAAANYPAGCPFYKNCENSGSGVTGRSGVTIAKWARSQPGVVVGVSHAQNWPGKNSSCNCATCKISQYGNCLPGKGQQGNPPFEFPVLVARGLVDFLEVEQPEKTEGGGGLIGPLATGARLLWKSLLNSGFKVPLTGGSDYQCIHPSVGPYRTQAQAQLSYQSFLSAIRLGKTNTDYQQSGWIDLRISGGGLSAGIGEELRLSGAGQNAVTVTAVAEKAQAIDIRVNDTVVASFSATAGVPVSREIMISKSAWIAAQSKNVQTSPVYVIVNNQPIRADARDACYLAEHADNLKNVASDLTASEKSSVFAEYDAAKNEFCKRVGEANTQNQTAYGCAVCGI